MSEVKLTVNDGDVIVVWFSNGAASAIAWQETLRRYGDRCEVRAVCNPVIEEDEDNLRFRQDVIDWLGAPLVVHANPRYPNGSAVDVWDRRGAMVFPHGAPCTQHLKKDARYDYESRNRIDWHVLGFTVDEKKRHDRFVLTERQNVLPVLIEAGLTKQDCIDRLMAAGIAPPQVYAEGYPNANCLGCVKATSPTYWNLVRRTRPAVFDARAQQSRRLGVRLVRYRGKRIFLDELPTHARGQDLKTMNVECGIFCEERPETMKIYLAGGMRTAWQDEVIARISPDHTVFDPRKHGLTNPVEYTKWDLDRVVESDILVAGMGAENPSGFGLSVEVGYAHALGKPVIFYDTLGDDVRSRYFGMHRVIAARVASSIEEVVSAVQAAGRLALEKEGGE